jgi:hypothetical protein
VIVESLTEILHGRYVGAAECYHELTGAHLSSRGFEYMVAFDLTH